MTGREKLAVAVAIVLIAALAWWLGPFHDSRVEGGLARDVADQLGGGWDCTQRGDRQFSCISHAPEGEGVLCDVRVDENGKLVDEGQCFYEGGG